MSSELTVYKASAGSGKTFTLAVEYIKRLIVQPRAYRHILAVTFTNKATAEMKERILSQLYGIACGDEASAPYLHCIRQDLKMTDEAIRERATQALSLLLHDYSYFMVETIDASFQTVMRSLARELGLGANLDISLNNEEILDKAVNTLIEELEPSSQVLGWIADFIRERIARDKRWHVFKEIKSFGRNIFNEVYQERGDGLREKLRQPSCITAYKKELETLLTHTKEEMERFADRFSDLLTTHGIEPEQLKGGRNGIASYFRKLKGGDCSDKLRNKAVENCLESEENWSTKTSPLRSEIVALAAAELRPLLAACEETRSTNSRIINSCELSLRYLNPLRLLNAVDEKVRQLNVRDNRFLLSDTNNLLCRLMQEGDSSFVFEKIGASIRHVMIDEFQDTSRMQWSNFKLLLMEGLAQGAGSLIAGDVKQSIYRWRNGDWNILNGLQGTLGPYPIREKKLSVNRRSETCIIRFNNTLFTEACRQLNLLYEEEFGQPCETLLSAYADVCQSSPKEEEKGYVQVCFLGKEKEMSYEEATLESLGEEVERLTKEGIRPEEMAILVRKNRNIPLIADYFSLHYPHLRIVSDEAFRLDASAAVNLMMDALRCLSDEKDTVAKARLAAAYQREVCGNETDWNTLLLGETDRFLPPAFSEERETLRMMPLYELVERLYLLFDLQKIAGQDAYLFSFYDAVTEFAREHGSDPDGFITRWEEKLCAQTVPAGEPAGIRICSIHKAKGLEFHTVLIPFCDWGLEGERNTTQLLWCTPEEAPFNQLDLIPVNYHSKGMSQSVFRKDYLHERLQLWVDNLNLLYVAFTRASKNLFVWAKAEDKNSVSALLAKALPALTQEAEQAVYTFGTLYPSAAKEQKRKETNRLSAPPTGRKIHMETFPGRVEFCQSNRSADFIRENDEPNKQEQYIRQGQLLHRLFSAIRTPDDVESVLRQMEAEGVVDSRERADALRRMAERATSLPQAAEWFSGEWELHNECSILQWTAKGELQVRRPDRVMIKDSEVVVVDFKFGREKPEYLLQVREYMQLLEQMGYPHVRGYLWYVYNNVIREVTT